MEPGTFVPGFFFFFFQKFFQFFFKNLIGFLLSINTVLVSLSVSLLLFTITDFHVDPPDEW